MRALQFAPNAIQADACIWYALMNTLTKYPSTAALTVLSTMPQWNDVSYFADILDRLSCYLLGRRQWATLLEVFYGLENRNTGSSLAQYAWIIGRAVQEGYLKTDREAESFFRIAFEAGNASFYYRAMAASKLGLSFAPAGEIPETEKNALSTAARKAEDRKTEAEFILGLFEYGAASFALPYLNAREAELSIPELRAIAETLAASDRLKESLDLIFRYTSREAYEICLQDLYLFYPQPYRELIEKYARESELEPEILYGLIRTESYFMPGAVSRSGAVGLAQLMPATATEMAGRIARRGGPDYSGQGMDLKDPELNIHIGSYYLRYLTEQMGSPMLAILAYNGGMGRVRRWLSADRQLGGLPQDLFLETIEFTETREYGRRVLAAAAVYGYLYY
jgi:soluble lytic murein transglycosylase